MRLFISFIIIVGFKLVSYSQATPIMGPTTTTIGTTNTYLIAGFWCPAPDDCSYWLTCSDPSVNIVSTSAGGCTRDFNVTFTKCGTFTLTGLRPCQGFTPGTITVTVTGPPASTPTVNSGSICSGNSFNLVGSCTTGNLVWYSNSCGGNIEGYGSPLSTGPLSSSKTYYARCEYECDTSACVSTTINVQNTPSKPTNLNASPISGCSPFNTTLSGSCASGSLRWYNSSNGFGAGIPPSQTITQTKTFYVRCYNSSNSSPCDYSQVDSITVTAFQAISNNINTTICEGQSVLFGVNNLNSTGVYRDTLLTSNGCDSILVLNLTVNPIKRDSINQSICFGDTYYFNGIALNSSGYYSDTLILGNGCDSIVTLSLTVNSVYMDTIQASICNGDNYPFNGNSYTVSGTYQDTLSSVFGCDSIVTLFLAVNPNIYDTITSDICQGQSYIFSGNSINTSGTYYDTLSTNLGCDSIIVLILNVNPVNRDTVYAEMCNGDTYIFNGNVHFSSGTYIDTLINEYGCDSITTLILTVYPNYYDTIYDTICEGYSVNFNGSNITANGVYTNISQSQHSCDSITTLYLYVIPTKRDTLHVSICEGDTYYFNGLQRNVSGIYIQNNILANGCDSITTLFLTINDNPEVSIIGNHEICNQTTGWLSVDGNFSYYLWNTGETSKSVSFYSSRNYVVTVMDNNNCTAKDSIQTIVVNCEDTCQIYVPNTFTPDNDGFNDNFFPKANSDCLFNEFQLSIFNRWGEVIFVSKNINNHWSGISKGVDCPTDTYIWVLEYKVDGNVAPIKKIGHVNLIR